MTKKSWYLCVQKPILCSKTNFTGEYSWQVLLVVKSTASLRDSVSVHYNAFTLSLSAPIVGTLLDPSQNGSRSSLPPGGYHLSSIIITLNIKYG